MYNKELEQSIKYVSDRFQYQPDKSKIFDLWTIMEERDGKLHGDCEDFSLTVFWHFCHQTFWVFIWNILFSQKFKLYRVKTRNGAYHHVGCYEDMWFDNFTNSAMTRSDFFIKTGHKIVSLNPRFQIAAKLIFGFPFRYIK